MAIDISSEQAPLVFFDIKRFVKCLPVRAGVVFAEALALALEAAVRPAGQTIGRAVIAQDRQADIFIIVHFFYVAEPEELSYFVAYRPVKRSCAWAIVLDTIWSHRLPPRLLLQALD